MGRILFACNSYPPALGGAEKVCKDMVDFLTDNHEVTVLTQPHPDRAGVMNIRPFIKEMQANSSYSNMPGLPKYLDENDFDLYISFGYGKYFSDYIGKWCKKHKKPCIFMPCGFFHTRTQKMFKWAYAKFLGKSPFMNYTKIITATQWEKDFWIAKYKIDSKKIIVIPYNLDPKFSKFKPTKILEKHGLNPKGYLLYIGRTGPNKLTKLLINEYRSSTRKIPLVFAGLGTENLVQDVRFGDTQGMMFLGKVSENDKKTLIAGAKLCIFPSNYESFGMVLLESISLSTPCIGSDIGPFRELLNHSLLLFNNDSDDLQYHLERAFTEDYPLAKINLLKQKHELNIMIKTLLFMERARNG